MTKYSLESPEQFGDSRTIGFTKLSVVFGFGKLRRVFCFPSFNFPCVALFNLINLIKYAMMQCNKSENLAHILGYQFWAVTGSQLWFVCYCCFS